MKYICFFLSLILAYQYTIVIAKLFASDYYTKKSFFIDTIPFFWVKYIYIELRNVIRYVRNLPWDNK
jgi:hypothetical protein